jgi:hypothetical protein
MLAISVREALRDAVAFARSGDARAATSEDEKLKQLAVPAIAEAKPCVPAGRL